MSTNLHPPLTAFPLALITAVVILEIINCFRPSSKLKSAIEINLFLAMIAAIAAFYSGYQAAENASLDFKVNEDIIAWHHTVGRLILFSIIPAFFLSLIAERAEYFRAGFKAFYYLLLGISFFLVVYTGYLGGELVFSYGAGVKVENRN